MTGIGGDTGRGVRVAARSVRTWNRIVNLIVAVALITGLGAGGWKTWNAATAHEWHVMGVYALSEFMLAAGFRHGKSKKLRMEDGETYLTTIGRIAEFEPYHDLRDRILGDVLSAALVGGGIGGGIVIGALVGARVLGRRLGRGRRLRGGELVSARELGRRAMPLHQRALLGARPVEARPYTIARVPWPEEAETLHTIVSGTTGSGKTVLISDLVEQIRARGERCIVYDKMGSYTETFFDEDRDVLLNPLDRRAPRWSPFLEARTAWDFDTMAAALIPRQKDVADPFWITAARQLFSNGAAVLWKRGETRNRVLVEHLLKTELSELAEAMEETVVQSIVDPDNPKTALSVRAMLTANIGALNVLPDEGEPFSIREWIENEEGGGFLFLTSRADQHASLRGLISTWLEIAVNALLSLPQDDGRRVWVILDELPTLHQLPSLEPGLAESRQYGGCFVLGVQVFSALRDLYGRDGATTISSLCGTRVVLAAPDKDTSEWSAKSLGDNEVESLSEGVSYDTPRDGVTLSTRRDLSALVLPSEVARLENLSGFLKLPGKRPVTRIRLRYRKRKKVAPRFVPKTEPQHRGREARNTSEERATDGAAPVAAGGTGGGASPVPGALQADPPRTGEEPDRGTAAPGGRNAETHLAGAPAAGDADGAMEDEPEAQGGGDVLGAAEWVHGGGSPPDAGGDAGDEPPWLLDEFAASASPQDVRPESPSRRQTGSGRAAGGDGGKSGSPDAAPGRRQDRRRPDAPERADGERQVRRPLWL